jgi:hypothetical protein
MREYHVRFCERPWVRSPRPTHQNNTVEVIEETGACDKDAWCYNELDAKNYFQRLLRKKIPPLYHPYRAGMARLVNSDPDKYWNELGWPKSECELKTGYVLIQRTEHGFIVGPFPEDWGTTHGQIFAIRTDNNTFDKIAAKITPDICVPGMGYH